MNFSIPVVNIFIVISCVLSALPVSGRPPSVFDIPVTRDLTGSPTPTRLEYLSRFPERPMRVYDVVRTELRRDEEGSVVVAVNHQLFLNHEEAFDEYFNDLRSEGYDVVLLDVEGGSAQELKNLIIAEGGEDLVGVILWGELPLAWFEHREYFRNEREPDHHWLVEYPIDLFFMDIDGAWQDTSDNGIYDVHSGSWEPDIWLGRLPAYNLSRLDEDELIANYLEKVHLFRQGELNMDHKALAFIDDDWIQWSNDWVDDMRLLYGGIRQETLPETTRVSVYKDRLAEGGYEFVKVAVHSSADSHLFRINNNRDIDYFRFSNLREDVVPRVMFYNLFACSAMNPSRNMCLGALYAIGGPVGLGAVGSTKTGSMLYSEDYYVHLGEGLNFGEALKNWIIEHARQPGRRNWARSWFYGMTHYGDPTLTVPLGLRVAGQFIDDRDGGDNDHIIDAGETVNVELAISNLGDEVLSGTGITVTSNDSLIEVLEGEIRLGEIEPDDIQLVDGIVLRISDECQDGFVSSLEVAMVPEDGDAWFDRFDVLVRSSNLAPESYGFHEVEGNGNGFVEPGETGELSILFMNRGGDDMTDEGEVSLVSLDEYFLPENDASVLPALASGESGNMEAVRFQVDRGARDQGCVFIRTLVQVNGIERGQGVIVIPGDENFEFHDDLDLRPVWGNHYPLTQGYHDVWRWAEDGGEGSGGIAYGGPDTLLYPGWSDAAYELPLLLFADDAVLTFRHRMEAEAEYDGGIVEVNRGEGWVRAIPQGGYNGNAVDNGSFPGGQCWSDSIGWTDVNVRLGGPSGPLRVRFRFGSDGGVEGAGWYIDQIRVWGTPVDAPRQIAVPQEFGFEKIYPNPFNSRLELQYSLSQTGMVSLYLLDLTGRRIETILTGVRTAGKHRLNYNAENLTSGVYILKLEAENRFQSAKITLVK